MHFQASRTLGRLLATMTPSDASQLFRLYKRHFVFLNKVSYDDFSSRLEELYKKDSDRFMALISNKISKMDRMDPKDAMIFLEGK